MSAHPVVIANLFSASSLTLTIYSHVIVDEDNDVGFVSKLTACLQLRSLKPKAIECRVYLWSVFAADREITIEMVMPAVKTTFRVRLVDSNKPLVWWANRNAILSTTTNYL